MDIKYLYKKVKFNNFKIGRNYLLLIILIVIIVWFDVFISNKKIVLYIIYNE